MQVLAKFCRIWFYIPSILSGNSFLRLRRKNFCFVYDSVRGKIYATRIFSYCSLRVYIRYLHIRIRCLYDIGYNVKIECDSRYSCLVWIDWKTRIRRKEGILRNEIPILQCDASLFVKSSNYGQIVTGESNKLRFDNVVKFSRKKVSLGLGERLN